MFVFIAGENPVNIVYTADVLSCGLRIDSQLPKGFVSALVVKELEFSPFQNKRMDGSVVNIFLL